MYGEPFYPADAVDWTRDGRYVAFITANRTLHLWDPFRPALKERTIDLGGEAFSLAFSPNGLSLAVGVGNAVRLIRLEP
jgi:WD40 repeat protein